MRSEYALLTRRPVTVTVSGTSVPIPYRPAAVWVEGVGRLNHLAVVLADQEEREALVDLVMDNPGALAEVKAESLRVLEEATQRNWWEAGRLVSTSLDSEVLGRLVLAGVDPWQRSIGEWVAAVYALCTKGQDEKGRIRFDFMLAIPPAGWEDRWDDEGDDPVAVADQVGAMLGKR